VEAASQIVRHTSFQRRIDEGEPPIVAAQRGARQVFFAVVATTIVLISVFALQATSAQAVAIALATPISFAGNKLWSFSRRTELST